MPDDLATLGVEARDVKPDSTGRNVAIGAVGIVVVIACLIPLTIGGIWVGSLIYAAVVSWLTGGPTVPSDL